jgi:heme/copper-type cytochrome/quinol oxidase subunit 1
VLATPVLAITLCSSIMENGLGIGHLRPALGGDPVLFQHFFWFYSHPAVYIMILPGMAIVIELIATFSRRKIFGYMFVAMSSVASRSSASSCGATTCSRRARASTRRWCSRRSPSLWRSPRA